VKKPRPLAKSLKNSARQDFLLSTHPAGKRRREDWFLELQWNVKQRIGPRKTLRKSSMQMRMPLRLPVSVIPQNTVRILYGRAGLHVILMSDGSFRG